jgi:hypothetical protein
LEVYLKFPNLAEGIFILLRNSCAMDRIIDSSQENELSRYREKYYQISHTDDSERLRDLIRELSISKKWQGSDDDWITIDNPSHIKLILENYADSDKRKILEVTSETPLQIIKILNTCNVPQTSVYRKIASLIQNGLITREVSISNYGRRLVKYKPVFEKVQINIIKNKITLKVIPTKS